MSLPSGVFTIQSKQATGPWVQVITGEYLYIYNQLACRTAQRSLANKFKVIPVDNAASTILLYDVENETWASRIYYFDILGIEYNTIRSNKKERDVFCVFTYEDLGDGGFKLKCDNGQYVEIDETGLLQWLDDSLQNDDRTVFFFEQLETPLISIISEEAQPLTLNTLHNLTATCTLSYGQQAPVGTLVYWSAQPDGYVTFSDPISRTDSQGIATTSVIVYGNSQDVPADTTVYARFTDRTGVMQKGGLSLHWQQGGSSPTRGQLEISLVSVDGPILTSGGMYPLKATYRAVDTGKPLAGQIITWSQDITNGIILEADTVTTDADGVAVNLVYGLLRPRVDTTITFAASAKNPTTHQTDSTPLPLRFTVAAVDEPQAGHMLVQIDNGGSYELTLGQEYTVTATYTRADGSAGTSQAINWAAYPSERIDFSKSVTRTDTNGVSTTTIVANGTTEIDGAHIFASTDNADSGLPDSGQAPGSFVQAVPAAWTGIEIDKGYTLNPDIGLKLDPQDPQETITLKMQTITANQTITLTTVPRAKSVRMFDGQFTPLVQDADTGGFTTTSSSTGESTVIVGAQSLAMCDVRATAGTSLSTRLVMATVSADFAGTMPVPSVIGMEAGNKLTIPPANQGNSSTFRMVFPPQPPLLSGDLIAVMVNGRLVWQGMAESVINREIDIAYATLNPGSNQLAYLRNSNGNMYESVILKFTATGTAQTGPDTSIPRSLPAASLKATPQTLDASAIVNGLTALINPGVTVSQHDVISTFFYLSGTDVSGNRINNIIRSDYTVVQGDELSDGRELRVTLPQGLIAGYTTGTVQVDYSLTPPASASHSWSLTTAPRQLNTTL